ncbi:helix-turn-helix domain-containing protein [Solibacillus sp. NPDC093137]|uniref:helix-turn-helix domain-containing protein n=1 Tax=Solibacillus sp. NPDC093137 TaxID=3390678 RepID=UPI003CFEDE74
MFKPLFITKKTMKPIPKKVGARIKAIRIEMKLSLTEFAEGLSITKAKLDSYERGLALPPQEIGEKIVLMLCNLKYQNLEWLYFGDITNYIIDYLKFLGYGNFSREAAHIVLLMYDVENCGPDPNEIVDPLDSEIEYYAKRYIEQQERLNNNRR